MNAEQKMVREFHAVFDPHDSDKPTLIRQSVAEVRAELAIEEASTEYLEAVEAGDLVGIADALGDALYIVYGTANKHGIDLEEIFRVIHESNMSKLGEDGKPIISRGIEIDGKPLGKVMKGPNFFTPEPEIERIIQTQLED